jgi:N-hydroxyarylamine O-acetyltransferase
MTTEKTWVARSLKLLGVEPEEPSLDALARLTRAHARTIPFENFNAILRRRAHLGQPVPLPDPEALLASWERQAGGALCFDVTAAFGQLLSALGYRVHAVLAQISIPQGHQALVVDLDGDQYLVDVGSGSPLLEPIPLDRTFEVHRAGLGFRFRRGDEPHELVQERLIDGAWTPFCRYDLRPADPSDRAAAYQRHHIPGKTWVVDARVLVLCDDDQVWVLRDGEYRHHTAQGRTVEQVSDPAHYARLARDVFGLPALAIVEALEAQAELSQFKDATT